MVIRVVILVLCATLVGCATHSPAVLTPTGQTPTTTTPVPPEVFKRVEAEVAQVEGVHELISVARAKVGQDDEDGWRITYRTIEDDPSGGQRVAAECVDLNEEGYQIAWHTPAVVIPTGPTPNVMTLVPPDVSRRVGLVVAQIEGRNELISVTREKVGKEGEDGWRITYRTIEPGLSSPQRTAVEWEDLSKEGYLIAMGKPAAIRPTPAAMAPFPPEMRKRIELRVAETESADELISVAPAKVGEAGEDGWHITYRTIEETFGGHRAAMKWMDIGKEGYIVAGSPNFD